MEYYSHPPSVIDEGCQIGKGTKIWHFCHVMGGAAIGENCILGQNVFVADKVRIGNNVKIQNNVSLYTGVICGDDVFLGPSMVFTNVINPRSAVNRKNEYKHTLVTLVILSMPILFVIGVHLTSQATYLYTEVTGYFTATLPWGEEITIADVALTPWGNYTPIIWLSFFSFSIYALVRQFRRGEKREAIFGLDWRL